MPYKCWFTNIKKHRVFLEKKMKLTSGAKFNRVLFKVYFDLKYTVNLIWFA